MSNVTMKLKSVANANWDREAHVVGRVVKIDSMEWEGKTRPFIVVETANNLIRVYDSAGLSDLFKLVSKGDRVDITFLGEVTTKNKRPMKTFAVTCWTDSTDGPVTTVVPDRLEAPSAAAKRTRKR